MKNFLILIFLSLSLSIALTKAREDCSFEITYSQLMMTCAQAKASQCDDLPRLMRTAVPNAPERLIKSCVLACKVQNPEQIKGDILSTIAVLKPECLFEVNQALKGNK